jgi:multiple sugar transport system ATP-binding protein
MRAELRRLHDQHASTTVYVTHDQIEAMTLGDRIAVVDHGRLQQVGTPHELYDRPANVFVAGFIGSPSMNFTPARLLPGTPRVLAAGQLRWPVDGDLAHRHPALADAGGAVTLGLRPDAFVWPAPTGMPSIEVTAAGVEALGHESHVLFTPPDGMPALDPVGPRAGEVGPLWSAKIRGRCDLRAGDSVTLGVDLTGAHFFDTSSGVSLRPATDDLPAGDPVPALTS